MKLQIQDEKAKVVLKELSARLGVSEETIINAAMQELVKQYVARPTTATMYVKTVLKRQGVC